MKTVIVAAAVGMLTAGTALAQPAPPPYPPVPAPRMEHMPPPPGLNYVWARGHWRWGGTAYVWVPGHYVVRRANYHQFVPGHWANHGGRWVWVDAHWQ